MWRSNLYKINITFVEENVDLTLMTPQQTIKMQTCKWLLDLHFGELTRCLRAATGYDNVTTTSTCTETILEGIRTVGLDVPGSVSCTCARVIVAWGSSLNDRHPSFPASLSQMIDRVYSCTRYFNSLQRGFYIICTITKNCFSVCVQNNVFVFKKYIQFFKRKP